MEDAISELKELAEKQKDLASETKSSKHPARNFKQEELNKEFEEAKRA